MGWIFTTILHKNRIALKLDCAEYCLLDLIHKKSVNPGGKIKGWCNQGNEGISGDLGVSRRTVIRMVKKLEQRGFVVLSDDRKLKKCTELWYNNAYSDSKSQGVTPSHTVGHDDTQKCDRPSHNSNNINKQTKEDFKEQSKKALELIRIGEQLEATILEFCTMNEQKISDMKNRSLFKGDHIPQISAFVQHNIENILFRGSAITFFVKKFPQWLRYAKNPISRKKAPVSYVKIMAEYYTKQVREKVLQRSPERFKAFEAEFNDVVVRAEVNNYYEKLKTKNKSYTPYFVYDVCFGMMADKAGTRPDRRFSKFRQWYKKLTEYQQNQFNLTQEFKKHLNR